MTAAADDDGRNDDTAQLTHRVTSSDAGYDDLHTDQPARVPAVDVTATDADAGDIGVTVDTDLTTPGAQATTLSVTEDGQTTATYTVVLGTEPDGPVTVADDTGTPGNDLAKATPAPGALTFDASTWDTAQTVTVTGAMDDDDMDETVSLAHTVTSGDPDYAGRSVDSVVVTVTDDEEPGLAVSAATAGLAVTEGASATYTIALNSYPEGSVTVTVTSSDAAAEVDTDATRQARELTFAAAAWNTAQTVTATAKDDTDRVNDDATLSHAVSGSGDTNAYPKTLAAVDVTVTVRDDDGGLDVGTVSRNTTAAGGTATFTVALLSPPNVAVVVAAASRDPDEGVAAPVNLTFSATTWNTAQMVTVTGQDDDVDDGNETYEVRLTPTSTDAVYGALDPVDVTLTNEDDDAALTVGAVTGQATETQGVGAMVAVFGVRLATEPEAPVTVAVTSQDPGEGTAAPANLTFAATGWNTVQTVTGVDDDFDDGNQSYTTHLDPAGAPADAYTALATHTSTMVTTVDDDTAGVVVDTDPDTDGAQTTLALYEDSLHAANAATYPVRLNAQPGGPVTGAVDVTGDMFAVGVAPDMLAFTAMTWNTAQTVTATAANDDDATSETAVTLAHRVSGTGDTDAYPTTLSAVTVTVGVTDDDTVGVSVDTDPGTPATVDSTALTVSDDGSTTTDTYTVVLNTQPSGAVTITPTVPATPDVVDVAPAGGLTFTATTWNTRQTVTVSGKTDTDTADTAVSLTHTLTTVENGGYAGVSVAAVAVTVTDADTVGVTVDTDLTTLGVQATTLSVSEDGTTTETYAVVLATQPTAPVTIAAADAPDRVDLTPAGPLVFTATTWVTAQTVTGTPDDRDATTETVTLTHTLTTATTGDYAAVSVAAVTVTEDDTPGLLVTPTALTLQEDALHAAHRGTYTLALNTQPGGPVTVRVDNADDTSSVTANGVGAGATLSLVFAANAWNTAQPVTVAAGQDDDGDDETVTLMHTTASNDTDFQYATSRAAENVTVTVADDDPKGVTVDPTSVAVTEQAAAGETFTVMLATQPAAAVTVSVDNANDASAVTANGTAGNATLTLTFATTAWNTAQTVTVVAVDDVTVEVTDNDAPNLSVSAAGLTGDGVQEGTAEPYTVALTTQPSGPVTVAVRSSDGNRATLATGTQAAVGSVTLTFAANAWNTAQPVTVVAQRDADAVDATVTLTHDPGGAEYAALADVSLTFTVTDTTPPADPTPGPDVMAAFAAPSFPDQTYKARQEVRVQLPAASAGNPPLTYTLTPTLPARLRYDGTTRRIVGAAAAVPTPAIATYTHTVTDADGDSATQTVRIEVVANPRPTFSEPAPSYTRGATYTLPAPSVADGGRLVFALTPALPEGLPYTPPVPSGGPGAWTYTDGGTITGVPEGGLPTNRYTLSVTDADGDVATVGFRLAQPTAVPPSPPVDGQPTFGDAAVEPQQYLQGETIPPLVLPAATGGDAPLSYALTPALPAGLTYTAPADATTGGLLSGTPAALQAEPPYTLTATDADGDTATLAFTLTVEADLLPSFGDATVAAHGYPVGTTIVPLVLPAATGGNAPLSYALTPALPPGLTYTAPTDPTVSGGTLAGTPTEVRAETTYTLTATDADGDTATLAFPLTITPTGRLVPGEGTTAYPIGGQWLTITRHLDTPAVEIDLPATLARDVVVTLAPPAADVPLARGLFGFGTQAAARAVVDVTVVPVPAGGVSFCLPVPAALRAEAAGRALVLLHYDGRQWAPVAGSEDDAAKGQVCATGVTTFSPFAVGYANAIPAFADAPPEPQRYDYDVDMAIAPVVLPAATGGDAPLSYVLTPSDALPAGLTYTAPVGTPTDGTIAGTSTAPHPATTDTLTVTDRDGDRATLTFIIAVERARVTVAAARGQEGGTVVFPVTLSRPLTRPLTLTWTANTPGSATPGEDYHAEAAGRLTLAAGANAGTLTVRTLDDRRVEPPETFTVTVTLPAGAFAEMAAATATGTIEDDDAEHARRRSLGMVLAGVGRTLATDAVDVIGDRFVQQPGGAAATVGGQELGLRREGDTERWRHAAGVAYGVARALGVEVGSPLEGGDEQFGQIRGAAWSALTRHLRDPHAPPAPLSVFAAPSETSLRVSPPAYSIPPPSPSTGSGTGRGLGGGCSPAQGSPAGDTQFGHAHPLGLAGDGSGPSHRGCGPAARVPRGLAGYGEGLSQRGFDRAHAATPEAAVWTLRAPVGFRRVSGAEVMSQSAFEIPLRRPPTPDAPPEGVGEEASASVDTAAQAGAAAWTLWGRGTASGFDGRPKDDFSMDGNVFTGYLGLDYRLQLNVLLGLAVAHSQGDVDYETMDVTKGDVDFTLTSILPYAHWSPRPGLGVWGLFGAGWGDLALKDEAGKVQTDLEMLMAAVGARQELLTWRQIDVALKADAFLTELEAGADDRLPKTAGDAQRLRLMLEGRPAWALSEESHLTPIFEIGGRWDGGKVETGVGAEMGGGFEYAHTKLGLGIEALGRYPLAHQKSAFDEWGASLTLKLDPGAAKRGLWLALAPVWSAEASQVEQMWGSADVLRAGAETAATPGLSPAQVEFDIGYGLMTHEGAGLLTTYGGVSMAGPQSHGYRLGGRIELGEWIDLSVEGERTTQGGGTAHQVVLYGYLIW